MDERTLNDLLECSVCLERLDTTSKVLPCQHTFCRKCLEVIVTSRQELRCPECRILVDIKVDDLPSNILLIRILEGMKNANANQNQQNSNNNSNKYMRQSVKCNDTGIAVNSNDVENSKNISSSNTEREQNNRGASNQKNLTSTTTNNRCIVPHAFALYDFTAKENGDLNFKKGDIILLKKKIDMNWLIGEVNGQEGTFPVNYVHVIIPLPSPQCIALYDFKMGPNEEEGCLTFKKGAVINVIRRVDHNWAEGRIGLCIGIFPIAFVEMNSLAKHLLDDDSSNSSTTSARLFSPRALPPIPFDNTNSTSDSTSSVTSPSSSSCSSNTSTNSLPSSPTNPSNSTNLRSCEQNANNSKDIKEKRYSLNAISGNVNLSLLQSNRHSADISSISHIDTQQETQTISNENKQSSVEPMTSNSSVTTGRSKDSQVQLQHNSRNLFKATAGHNTGPSLPWAYVALYPYKPRKSDELELKKGCIYFVTERCLDGWYKGKNWQDKSGVFPGNYVTPLRSRDQQQLVYQRKNTHNTPVTQSQQMSTLSSPLQSQEQQSNSLVQHTPPELPPRCNTMPSNSAWGSTSRPTNHQTEAICNRKSKIDGNKTPVDIKEIMDKISNINAKWETHCNNSVVAVTSFLPTSSNQLQHQPIAIVKDKKETNSAVSLMKRLTNMKRSKSPTQSTPTATTNQKIYSVDNPGFEDVAVSSSFIPSTSKQNLNLSTHPVHVRSGSCPSQLLQSLPIEHGLGNVVSATKTDSNCYGSQRIKNHKERPSLQSIRQQAEISNRTTTVLASNKFSSGGHKSQDQQQSTVLTAKSSDHNNGVYHHRKTQSLDTNAFSNEIKGGDPSAGSSSAIAHGRDRFRCIVSYPPNSELELELNVGDIVYVHKKQKNGWYKGTHSRTNKIGLFPASFVEPDI